MEQLMDPFQLHRLSGADNQTSAHTCETEVQAQTARSSSHCGWLSQWAPPTGSGLRRAMEVPKGQSCTVTQLVAGLAPPPLMLAGTPAPRMHTQQLAVRVWCMQKGGPWVARWWKGNTITVCTLSSNATVITTNSFAALCLTHLLTRWLAAWGWCRYTRSGWSTQSSLPPLARWL